MDDTDDLLVKFRTDFENTLEGQEARYLRKFMGSLKDIKFFINTFLLRVENTAESIRVHFKENALPENLLRLLHKFQKKGIIRDSKEFSYSAEIAYFNSVKKHIDNGDFLKAEVQTLIIEFEKFKQVLMKYHPTSRAAKSIKRMKHIEHIQNLSAEIAYLQEVHKSLLTGKGVLGKVFLAVENFLGDQGIKYKQLSKLVKEFDKEEILTTNLIDFGANNDKNTPDYWTALKLPTKKAEFISKLVMAYRLKLKSAGKKPAAEQFNNVVMMEVIGELLFRSKLVRVAEHLETKFKDVTSSKFLTANIRKTSPTQLLGRLLEHIRSPQGIQNFKKLAVGELKTLVNLYLTQLEDQVKSAHKSFIEAFERRIGDVEKKSNKHLQQLQKIADFEHNVMHKDICRAQVYMGQLKEEIVSLKYKRKLLIYFNKSVFQINPRHYPPEKYRSYVLKVANTAGLDKHKSVIQNADPHNAEFIKIIFDLTAKNDVEIIEVDKKIKNIRSKIDNAIKLLLAELRINHQRLEEFKEFKDNVRIVVGEKPLEDHPFIKWGNLPFGIGDWFTKQKREIKSKTQLNSSLQPPQQGLRLHAPDSIHHLHNQQGKSLKPPIDRAVNSAESLMGTR